MPGHIEFMHDEDNDIVVATPKWHIETEEDCKVWYKQWETYLQKFGRKMDCIMLLSDFKVDAGIGAAWGRYRAELNKQYVRYGYRVNPDIAVSLYTKTSGVRYSASTSEAADYESAIKAIMDARSRDR
jgi:hypothetical protein